MSASRNLPTRSRSRAVTTRSIADDGEFVFSCSAVSAGGSSGPVDVAVKRDATKPTISGSRTPEANAFGWNDGLSS